MIGIYLIIAVSLLILGHICKARRWKLLLSSYETVPTVSLLRVLAIGQGINMVLPFRVGDVARICLLGKKHLKNGYVLALASVVADMFIDTITVGLAFGSLYLLNIHGEEIREIAIHYELLSAILVATSLLMWWQKKYVKLLIQKAAAVFNSTIERKILVATYAVFASIKDTFERNKIVRLAAETVGVWVSYFMSYGAFAIFLQKLGYDFTLTKVFHTIFSMVGSPLLVECVTGYQGMQWMFWFFLYLLLPLCLIYLYSSLAKGRQIQQEGHHIYRRILPQMNPSEKLAFLNIYFSGKQKDYIDRYLEINNGISVLEDFSAGSNATTMLCMDEERTFYRKYAFGEDAKKLWEQVEWLRTYEKELPVANIFREYRTEEYCYYDMEYRRDTLGFFRFIHTSSEEDSFAVLKGVLDSLSDKLYSCNVRPAETSIIQSYVDKKVTANIRICEEWGNKKFRSLYQSDTVVINGNAYKNLSYYADKLTAEYLSEVFWEDEYAVIHGDLTIENIVCRQGAENGWYLIDPNTGSLHETPFLDYAKLLQSLHGRYEFLMMVKNVQVTDNRVEFLFTGSSAYQKLYECYKAYLFEKFSWKQVKSIYYHEVVHWLRLMPYKIRKDPQLAVVFYAGLLMVLADVEKIFKDEK